MAFAGMSIAIMACSSGLNSSEPSVRKEAVKRLTDQKQLAAVALRDSDTGVRLAAVRKLTDQQLLVQIALENSRSGVRGFAVDRVIDPSVLATIAMKDSSSRVRVDAISSLSRADRDALSRSNVGDASICFAKCHEIVDKFEVILMVLSEFDDLPINVRRRVIQPILTVIWALPKHSATADMRIAKIQTEWEATSQSYTSAHGLVSVNGGNFAARITIEFEKQRATYAHTWRTDFPDRISDYKKTLVPNLDASRLLVSILGDLAQPELASVSLSDAPHPIRRAAVENLKDQRTLAIVAIEDRYHEARKAAVKNLTDQQVLATVALEDKHWAVRQGAVRKLIDRNLLQTISTDDAHEDVRNAAGYHLIVLDKRH